MRQTRIYEFWVGLFLLLGMAALVFLGLKVANIQGFSETKSYKIHATFDNIGGLKVRAPLKVGGVVSLDAWQILLWMQKVIYPL